MTQLSTEVEKISYALGMNIAASVLQLPIEVNKEIIIDTVMELLRGGQPQLPEKEYHEMMQTLQSKLQAAAKEHADKAGKQNLEEGLKFLAENAKKPGIVVTKSGLQYEVLKEGNGGHPAAASTVKVHYEGKLLNGNIFDSSVKRGEPIEF